ILERRTKAAGILLERGGHQHRCLQMLQGVLRVQIVKDSVLDNLAAKPPTGLRALKGLRKSRRGRQGRTARAIVEKAECFAMDLIGTGSRSHISFGGGPQITMKR